MFLGILVHAGFDHFPVQVVTLTGPLTHTGEDRVAAKHLGDIVDQFLDQNRLADAGAAEQADLAALGVGQSRSTTLIPVGRISAEVACSSKDGAGRWIGARCVWATSPASSMLRR